MNQQWMNKKKGNIVIIIINFNEYILKFQQMFLRACTT